MVGWLLLRVTFHISPVKLFLWESPFVSAAVVAALALLPGLLPDPGISYGGTHCGQEPLYSLKGLLCRLLNLEIKGFNCKLSLTREFLKDAGFFHFTACCLIIYGSPWVGSGYNTGSVSSSRSMNTFILVTLGCKGAPHPKRYL